MTDFLYSLIIFPIVQIIELCYLFVYRVFHNPGIALFGVSIAVSVFTLPLYLAAEKFQQKERDLQKRLKPKIEKIKSVFRGDEQYMVLSAYYKQNHYHPIYSLRNTFGLLIQIPFFIAAYSYLSHLHILQRTSFLFIADLGKPDGILSFYNSHFNILPILMTIINIVSCMIYTKNLQLKDKIQLYGMSLLFLILLYNSPAGLVLYWTMNNVFSLARNIIQKANHPHRIILIIIIPFAFVLDIYLLFFHSGDLPNRLLATGLISASVFLLLFIKPVKSSGNQLKSEFPVLFYLLSCLILFLLHGGIIPSSLIVSSVGEFSFIGSRTTPFPFLFQTIKQSSGIFLFWPLIIYLFSPSGIRRILTYIMLILSVMSIINVFLITENFGFLTTTMVLSEPKPFSLIPWLYIINLCIVISVSVIIFLLLFYNKRMIVLSLQIITIAALFGYFAINSIKINNNFILVKERDGSNIEYNDDFTCHYTFSKTGKNVLFVMLDCAIGSYVPYIFEEKPELASMMRGFRWYPNCASFANHTLIGAPPVYGGYEYTPSSINTRDNTLLVVKQEEAYLLLPVIFSNAGYSIKITDPPFDNYRMSNLAIFSEHPEFHAENIIGKYTVPWIRNHDDIATFNISELLDNNLIRFSFFKSAPLFLRLFIYDKGKWLRLADNTEDQLTDTIINDYAFLDSLDKITDVTGSGNTYTAVYAHLPHSAAFLQAPGYIPVQKVTNRGTGPLANDPRFHLTTASFLMLGKWFRYLEQNGVYDNTRIIIVSDHGRGSTDFPGNITLPDGSRLQSYNALLMVKDFYADYPPQKSDVFMTNADAPLFALNDLIENPQNPFTKINLQADKNNGITIATIGAVSTYRHSNYIYNIGKNQWLYVKDNIFDPANWKAIQK